VRNANEIKQDVRDELLWDPRVNDGKVKIDVNNNVVTLSGSVDSYTQRLCAALDAERVFGVSAVVNHLDVVVPSFHARSDKDIARAAVDALQWNVDVPANRITVRVDNGTVTLDGSVDWYYQKSAAESAVQGLFGVRSVVDRILVEPQMTPSPIDVRDRIVAALKRGAETDADNITVDTDGNGQVTLRGIAHSWAERDDAERAAWMAPGVRTVNDQLVVQV
jgi:osmotically-inducible protein OsmY